MRRLPVVFSVACVALAVAACASFSDNPPVQFWRPISEPNLLMPSDTLQKKLDFDLSQCHCGIYPANASRDDIVQFQPDRQRLAQTGVTVTPNEDGQCQQQPSLVVTECMRQRGWEPTNCSGRMALPNGGSLCASYTQPVE
ncbi:MAG: hypothetical protein P4M13_10020 [Alphaproteobacteria bacterium]|nr:hypothetical protein [Alphaproteobacteria bacterium]